jgi:hypothetical protein
VRRWHREGRLCADQYFLRSWKCRGQLSGEMIVLAKCDDLILVYKSLGLGATKAEPILQQVAITWTGLHYGGRRPWFVCGCGRRAAVLYTVGGLFRCRRCHSLVYASQKESPRNRNLRAAQKIRLRLGGSPDIFDFFPQKPRRMHWRSYDRLRARAERSKAACMGSIERWLSRTGEHRRARVR